MSASLWACGPQPIRLLCPGIVQARTLEGVAAPSSRGASWPRDQTQVSCISCIGRRVLQHQLCLGSHSHSTFAFYCQKPSFTNMVSWKWTQCDRVLKLNSFWLVVTKGPTKVKCHCFLQNLNMFHSTTMTSLGTRRAAVKHVTRVSTRAEMTSGLHLAHTGVPESRGSWRSLYCSTEGEPVAQSCDLMMYLLPSHFPFILLSTR